MGSDQRDDGGSARGGGSRPDRTDALDRLAAIRHEQQLPDAFPDEVLAAAEVAATSTFACGPGTDREDLRDVNFQTLDPASSTDLDQAFAVSDSDGSIVLQYALADVGAFVPHDGVISNEAWQRGVTVYAPDNRVSLYPTSISQRAASLLPDGPRPAIVVDVSVPKTGDVEVLRIRRAVIQSRAKLAYETTTAKDLSPLIVELHKRMTAAELARGATKVDFPEQEVVADPRAVGGYRIVLRPMRESEEINSSMSLAANFAIAKLMIAHGYGLFRVMPDPDAEQETALRRMARGLAIEWPKNMTTRDLIATLDRENARHAKFLVEARRAGRGASYELFGAAEFASGKKPWHSALAAPYAHATAPMRRLADRYVLELAMVLMNGGSRSALESVLPLLPKVMADASRRANAVDGAVLDLLEAIALEGRVNEEFTAVVVSDSHSGVVVQLAEPPVRARATGRVSDAVLASLRVHEQDLGDLPSGPVVRVRLTEVDVDRRRVRFELLDADEK